MLFADRMRRVGGAAALGLAALGVAGVAIHPAAAAAALAVVQSAVTCATTAACVSGTNTGSGPGVTGTSKKGIGVTGIGTTASGMKGTSASLYGVHGVSTTSYGVLGESTSGGAGVVGTTPARYGVYGYTSGKSGGYGVYGASYNGYGVYGATTSGSGIGVIGYETGNGTGTYGFSGSGYGLEGITSSGDAIYADAYGGGTGVYIASGSGYGLIDVTSGSLPVYARNSSGNGGDFQGSYIGLIGRSPSSGFPLVLTDTASNNLFYVDGSGNVSYKGGLFHFSIASNGASVKSFGASATSPTVEDTGTAQLVGGAAAVRLDPTFAASIDRSSAYRVFVTPNGDTRGLFVATKTPSGFVVRESQGGRSTVSFDYRVIATALGQTGQRMAVVGAATTTAAPQAALPVVPLRKPEQPLPPSR